MFWNNSRFKVRAGFAVFCALALSGVTASCATQASTKHPLSDHFNGKEFFNPGLGQINKGFWDLAKWSFTESKADWPEWVEGSVHPPCPSALGPEEVCVTFINHATLLIQAQGVNILTDPIYSERASPVSFAGPKRVHKPGIAFEDLPPLHAVLLSHDHYDHFDLDTLEKIARSHTATFVTGLGNRSLLEGRGISRIVELDWWQQHDLGVANTKITMTPAQHWSGRKLWGRNASLWGSYVIEAAGKKIFFAGDTGYSPHFAEIGKRFGGMDVSLLPLGAFEPRWFMREQHVNPPEALQAHFDVRSRTSIGMHFGTFQLSSESRLAPVEALKESLQQRGLPMSAFLALEFGNHLLVR